MIKQSELNAMSNGQLTALIRKADKTLKSRTSDRAKRRIAAELARQARRNGFSLKELAEVELGGRESGRHGALTGRKVPPKYRDPGDPTRLWSGRGRQPLWIRDGLAAGMSMSEFEIGD